MAALPDRLDPCSSLFFLSRVFGRAGAGRFLQLGLAAALYFMSFGCASRPPAAGPSSFAAPAAAAAPFSPGGSSFYAGFSAPRTLTHVVGPYETLWRISKTYDVDMNSILSANNLSSQQLKEGQKLIIPGTMGPRPYIPLPPATRWTYIVVHHTATHDGNASFIQKLHFQRGFWNGMGYHFLIDNGTENKGNGQIEVGPRWAKQMDGAHANADDMNIRGIGVCLVGNFSESNVPQRQLESLVYLVRLLQKRYGIPSDRVIRHSEVRGKNTECPGTRFPWSDFKRRLGNP